MAGITPPDEPTEEAEDTPKSGDASDSSWTWALPDAVSKEFDTLSSLEPQYDEDGAGAQQLRQMPSSGVQPGFTSGAGLTTMLTTAKVAPAETESEEKEGGEGGDLSRALPFLSKKPWMSNHSFSHHSFSKRLPSLASSGSYRSMTFKGYTARKEEFEALLNAASERSKRANVKSIKGVVIAFTVLMITLETSSKNMVITILGCYTGNVGLAVHRAWGDAGVIGYGALVILVCGLTYHAIRSLEAVEVCKRRFAAVFAECTQGIKPGSDKMGPKSFSPPELMQDWDHDVDYYLREAERLYPRFKEEVLDVLESEADPRGKSITVLSNLKKRERAEEKIRIDYKGNAAMVKDYLRATFVVPDMPWLCRVCDAADNLETRGGIEILSIKNRLRGQATSLGYRDLNMNVSFEGHVCEIQIQLVPLLNAKHEQRSAYRLVRSLDLEDEVEEAFTHADLAAACSPATRTALGGFRFSVAAFTSVVSVWYIMFGSFFGKLDLNLLAVAVYGNDDVPGLLRVALQAPPFAIVSVVALRDLFRQIATTYSSAPFWKGAAQASTAVLLWLVTAAVTIGFFSMSITDDKEMLMCILFWSLFIIGYAWATAPSVKSLEEPIVRSRIALLYEKYFGLNGEYFGIRVQVTQLLSVALQAFTKLRLLGAFVNIHPRIGPANDIGMEEYFSEEDGGISSAPIYWVFFGAIVVNALYPAALLVHNNVFVSRSAVAKVDAALDIVYSLAYTFVMASCFVWSAALPTAPLDVLALFYPTVHAVFVCRSIEVAAADLQVRKRRAQARKRSAAAVMHRRGTRRTVMAVTGTVEKALPLWKGVRFAFVAMSVVVLAVVTQCRDRYPMVETVPGGCAPCVCSNGVLEGCPFHAEINDPFIHVDGRGLTAVEPGAFRGNEAAVSVFLNDNALETLPAGAFDGLQNVFFLRLDNNRLSVLPVGVFDKLRMLGTLHLANNEDLAELPSGLFDGLRSLRALDLRHTSIKNITSATFRGMPHLASIDLSYANISDPVRKGTFAQNTELKYVSLAGNSFGDIEAGAFGDSIGHVWLTGTGLTCAAATPLGSADCIDGGSCSAFFGVSWLGDGWCDSSWDPKYDTADCLWDGGDCTDGAR